MVMTRYALPLRVEFRPGESATSFASRLARRNGAPRLITFCSDVGIDYFNLVNGGPEDIARLAGLGATSADDLQCATPQLVEPGYFRLGQVRIKFTAFTRTAPRGCPHCLQVARNPLDVAQLGIWQLASIRTCDRHGCYLVPLPKPASNKDTFDIPHLLDSYAAVEPVPADPKDLVFEHDLRRRIDQGAGTSWLDRLPFHVAAQTCENFGVLLTRGPEANRDDLSPAQWAKAGSAGYAVLRQGPEAFRQKLKDIQDAHPIDNTLYRTRYRVFFEWLRYRDDDPAFDPIRDLVRDFIFRNFPISEGTTVLGKPCPEQFVHSLSTARSTYGVSGWKLARRLAALGLAERKTVGKGFVLKAYVPSEVVSGIVTELDALLNAGEAAQHLGIERFMLEKLTRPGLIDKFFDERNSSPLYHPRALDGFTARLRKLAKGPHPGGETLDIASAAHRLRIPTERLVDIILRNRIPLRAEDPQTARFGGFRVSLAVLRETIASDHEGAVRPSRAAEILGITIRTVRALLDQGHLEARMVREMQSGRERRYVCARALERFAQTHITVVALAAKSGRLPGAEAIVQTDRGARALELGTRTNMIFRRADVS
ncbi:TniQ family protein [Paenirhodobacter sp. CAU 1674]|uniref:TniQ family protein n=1 Tax=Paenirhodobacter sp. CAU 1674 TaxID=3032596 RepID=UPI0023DB265C|nr:TniQ family protein [Paenirhodobacter sp. CAU 1674]MDF2143280.1 TniQ family protein [Paenirhodobacter sp. CAU 1674]